MIMLYLSCNNHTYIYQIFTKSDIIKNCDALMTIIIMLKFTQLPRPNVRTYIRSYTELYYNIM